jgi:hypothetical protein
MLILLVVCAKIGDNDDDIKVLLNTMASVAIAIMIDLPKLAILSIIEYSLLVVEQRENYFGF